MPQDGTCLFHCLGRGAGLTGHAMRMEIARIISVPPSLDILGSPLSQWIFWDSGVAVGEYAARVRNGAWGGGIECAVYAARFGPVHVFKQVSVTPLALRQVSDYLSEQTAPLLNLCWVNGMHYDLVEHVTVTAPVLAIALD